MFTHNPKRSLLIKRPFPDGAVIVKEWASADSNLRRYGNAGHRRLGSGMAFAVGALLAVGFLQSGFEGIVMKKYIVVFLFLLLGAITVNVPAAKQEKADTFSRYVDNTGKLRVPDNYRTEWTFLGTWSVARKKGEPLGAAGFHNVYTQPETVTSYKKTGKFPDGSVLVKGLLKTKTDRMTTGTVSWGHEFEGWFVMIKDTQGRYPASKLWGNGWGWALFDPEGKMVTKDYKKECITCHIPARETDWIYIQGYPLLN